MSTNRIRLLTVMSLGLTAGLMASGVASAPSSASRQATHSTQAKIAYIHKARANQPGPDELYVMNADGSGQTRLARNVSSFDFHVWSPDGRKIAYMGPRSDRGVNDI